jgi:hypothetical protein
MKDAVAREKIAWLDQYHSGRISNLSTEIYNKDKEWRKKFEMLINHLGLEIVDQPAKRIRKKTT